MLELALTPLHMGALHPVEKALVLLVAFGPFVVLFAVVYVVRRRDIAEEEARAQRRGGPGRHGRTLLDCRALTASGLRRARPGRPAARSRGRW